MRGRFVLRVALSRYEGAGTKAWTTRVANGNVPQARYTADEILERRRDSTRRYRAPQTGPAWPTVAQAGKRLDALLNRDADVGHDLRRGFQALSRLTVQREIHPLAHLWA